jgi:hypothetical protein
MVDGYDQADQQMVLGQPFVKEQAVCQAAPAIDLPPLRRLRGVATKKFLKIETHRLLLYFSLLVLLYSVLAVRTLRSRH